MPEDATNTLDPRQPASRWPPFCALLLVPLVLITATTAIRIEILNRAAGGILPRHEFRDDGTLVKWRQALWVNEARWRELLGPRGDDGQPVTRPLAEAEQVRMARDIRQARANNTLRDVVQTWGLAQHALMPLTLVFGVWLLLGRGVRRSLRVLGGVGICVALAAGVLLVHRAYFWSLGW